MPLILFNKLLPYCKDYGQDNDCLKLNLFLKLFDCRRNKFLGQSCKFFEIWSDRNFDKLKLYLIMFKGKTFFYHHVMISLFGISYLHVYRSVFTITLLAIWLIKTKLMFHNMSNIKQSDNQALYLNERVLINMIYGLVAKIALMNVQCQNLYLFLF